MHDIFCFTKNKYAMYIIQDYNVLNNNAVGIYFTHMWKIFA